MSKATKNLKESRVSVDSKTAAKVRRIAESSRASLSDIILFFANNTTTFREVFQDGWPVIAAAVAWGLFIIALDIFGGC